MDYSKTIKAHEDEINKLKQKQEHAAKLWIDVVGPMSHDDRKLLFDLLHDYFHSDDDE